MAIRDTNSGETPAKPRSPGTTRPRANANGKSAGELKTAAEIALNTEAAPEAQPLKTAAQIASETPSETSQSRIVAPEELEAESEVGFAPKTFLIPYVLLMLRDSLLHGYAIWEKLMLMGIPGLDESDRATIYRTLRQLERDGKVKSEWDTNSDGPARRVYSLTDTGRSFLQIWAVGLDQYRQSLDFFFKMYTNPFGINLNDFKRGKK